MNSGVFLCSQGAVPYEYLAIRICKKEHYYGFLAGKPSNTFLEAMEKVLEGLVKNGGVRALRK